MDYKNWKILKKDLEKKQEEYSQVAEWCNDNDYHIEEVGEYYQTAKNPEPIPPTHDEIIKQQIRELEEQITDRNIRGAILGDEFAVNKITQIEAQIEELRKELED